MQKFIYLKQTVTQSDFDREAFTTLTGALNNLGIPKLYQTVRAGLIQNGVFTYGNTYIFKIKLNHQTYGKK